jgi:hypothetical protein
MITTNELALYRVTDDVDAAVNEITTFYRIYHSSRYVRDQLVVRLTRAIPEAFVTQLALEFRDIIRDGAILQHSALPVERDEPALANLPRLLLRFDRLHFGRLRLFINRLNTAPED